MPDKPVICIDFDGVIHKDTLPYDEDNQILDEPVPGALEAIRKLQERYTIVILSARARFHEPRKAMYDWLRIHGFGPITVTNRKPKALIYLDDRGIRFDGDWPAALEAIKAFKPWHKGRFE